MGKTGNLAALIAACLCWLTVGMAVAKERPWYKYENAYFEVYSDASEKKVRGLLEELENFRAAVAQILTFEIPAGAVKTQVIILRSKRDFRKITEDRLTAAFMIGVRGIPHIVMPAASGGDWSRTSIRHEYTHVLMAYSGHRFPRWYKEGFAELMSGTKFRNKGTKFTFGERIGRQRSSAAFVPWDELLSGDFEFHSVQAGPKLSNAYLQSWLLVHYLTIGEKFKRIDNFGNYLGRFATGESSESALDAVFGMTPREIGNFAEQKYSKRIPYYELDFISGIQDLDFARSGTDAETVTSAIAEIHDLFAQARE